MCLTFPSYVRKEKKRKKDDCLFEFVTFYLSKFALLFI